MRISVYKPSQKIESGVAFQFRVGQKRNSSIPVMFIEAVRQSKPKPPPGSTESPFNWKDDKIVMMLNPDELGKLAACICGLDRKPIDFTHQSESNGEEKTSFFKLTPPATEEQKKYGNWGISVSIKTPTINKSVAGFIDPGVVYRLKHLADDILGIFNDLPEGNNANDS